MDQSVIDKIKKCLELSKSPEAGEAAAAMAMAQKLMEKYGVSETQLKLSDIDRTNVRSTASVSKVKKWELILMKDIARAFGCEVCWRNGWSYGETSNDVYGNYTFIGLKAQLPIVEYTASVLLRKLKASRSKFVQSLPQHWDRQRKIKEAEGFATGWVMGIHEKVHDFAGSDDLKENIQEYVKQNIKLSDESLKPQQRAIGALGSMAGLEASQDESLHRPMDQADEAKALTDGK